MRQKSVPGKEPATQVVKNIRRATRRHFSAEDKIRIVLEGLRGEDSIAELCRRERIVQNLYYRWSKDFLEAGKKRLAGDTARVATSDEVKDLRREASALKEVVAELTLENRLLKKSVTADGEDATWGTGRQTSAEIVRPATRKLSNHASTLSDSASGNFRQLSYCPSSARFRRSIRIRCTASWPLRLASSAAPDPRA
jgi:transposase